jgi:hypothetical protein
MKKLILSLTIIASTTFIFANNTTPVGKSDKKEEKTEKLILKTEKTIKKEETKEKVTIKKNNTQSLASPNDFFLCLALSTVDPTIAPSCYLLLLN